MVCGLDVCNELDGYPSAVYVNDCEEDYTDEVTGATLFGDDVARARAEEMAWYDKFQVHGEVLDGETSTKVTANEWKCEVDWSRARSTERDGQFLRRDTTAGSRERRDQQSCNENEDWNTTTTHGT